MWWISYNLFFLIKENLSSQFYLTVICKPVLSVKSENDQFQPTFNEITQLII